MNAFPIISSPSWPRSYSKARSSCRMNRTRIARRRQSVHRSRMPSPSLPREKPRSTTKRWWAARHPSGRSRGNAFLIGVSICSFSFAPTRQKAGPMLLDDNGQETYKCTLVRSGIFAEKSHGVVPPRTHRQMSHYTRRVRRGRKDSWEPPIPKACYLISHIFFHCGPDRPVQSSGRRTDICASQAAGASTMARVTVGSPLGISVEICNGATRYVTPHPTSPSAARQRQLIRLCATQSYRRVSAAFRAHRGRGETFVAGARVPFLHFAVRDRIRTAKSAERVDHDGSAGHRLWWACCSHQQQ